MNHQPNAQQTSVFQLEFAHSDRIFGRHLQYFFGYLSIITVFLHYTVIIFIIAANSNRLKVLYFHYAVNKQSLKEEKRISVLFWICFLIWCAFIKNLLSPSLLPDYLSRLKYIFGICLRVCKCVWERIFLWLSKIWACDKNGIVSCGVLWHVQRPLCWIVHIDIRRSSLFAVVPNLANIIETVQEPKRVCGGYQFVYAYHRIPNIKEARNYKL